MSTRGITLLLLTSIASLVGCGGPGVELGQVSGIVRLDGVPLANVRVEFVPEPGDNASSAAVPIATATTGSQGEYRLQLPGGRSGAPVGWQRVVVEDLSVAEPPRSREEADETPLPAPASRVPAAYRLATRTPLRLEVKPGPQDMPLDLQSVAPRN